MNLVGLPLLKALDAFKEAARARATARDVLVERTATYAAATSSLAWAEAAASLASEDYARALTDLCTVLGVPVPAPEGR